MKRFATVAIAVAMAIGFSAFSTVTKEKLTLYYKAGPGNFPAFTGNPCPIQHDTQCQSIEPSTGQLVNVYTAQNDSSPLLARF